MYVALTIVRSITGRTMASEKSTAATKSSVRRGGDLFIVDNSVEGWSGIRYLQ